MKLSLEKSADWSKSERRDIDGLNPSVDGLEGDLVVRWEIWLKA
jgi:hypothetical protein